MKSLFIRVKKLKKIYNVFLKIVMNKYIKSIRVKANVIHIKSISNHIYPLLSFLKNHSLNRFKVLVDIIGYDTPGKKYRFSLIYNLLSIELNTRLQLKIKLKEKTPLLNSVVGIYPSAGWLEREVWDLFGVFFFNNLDLRRILTDYGFIGYPLRKDFPLSGFIEVIYDDTEKQVVYKQVDFAQNFRNYRFKNVWKKYK